MTIPYFQDSLLMNVIIEQMTCDSDPEMGSAVQLMGIIRTLLDPENMLASVNKSEKTDFLSFSTIDNKTISFKLQKKQHRLFTLKKL